MSLVRTVPMRVFAGAAAALALGACSDSTGPDTLDEALVADMAVVAADATLEDVGVMSLPFGFSTAGDVLGDGAPPGRPGGREGFGHELSGTHEVSFFDADGNAQDFYDPLETESIHLLVDIAGEVTRAGWTAMLTRSKEMTISGLAGEETQRTFDGTGSEEVVGTRLLDSGEARTHSMVGTITYQSVVVPVPGSEPGYPLSGTITREMTATVTTPFGTRTRSVEVTITFDGDETATIDVNGETFEVDLTAERDRNPLRPHG